MPNDRWGNVERMWLEQDICACYLTLEDTELYHPLWIATAAAQVSAAWDDIKNKHRTNELALQYLVPQNPFIMFHNFESKREALDLLRAVRK